MDTLVEFTSSLFKPVLSDEAQVNPGVYGAELAFWLCKELAKRGVVTSYPICEDWGWFIEYASESGEEYWLGCSNLEDSDNRWHCFLEGKSKSWFKLEKCDPKNAEPLMNALRQLLDETAEVSDVKWSP